MKLIFTARLKRKKPYKAKKVTRLPLQLQNLIKKKDFVKGLEKILPVNDSQKKNKERKEKQFSQVIGKRTEDN